MLFNICFNQFIWNTFFILTLKTEETFSITLKQLSLHIDLQESFPTKYWKRYDSISMWSLADHGLSGTELCCGITYIGNYFMFCERLQRSGYLVIIRKRLRTLKQLQTQNNISLFTIEPTKQSKFFIVNWSLYPSHP